MLQPEEEPPRPGCASKRCTVNRTMLPMKAHYFLFASGTAPIVPYMATYARQLGFNTVQVGLIYTVLPFVGLIVKPVFGLIGDKFRLRKKLLIVWVALSAIAFFGVRFIQPIPPTLTFGRPCGSGADVIEFCPDVEPKNACLLKQVNGQRYGDQMQCLLHCDKLNETSLDINLEQIEQFGDCLRFSVLHNTTTGPTCLNPAAMNCTGTCSNANIGRVLAGNREDIGTNSDLAMPPELIIFVVCLLIGWSGCAVLDSMSTAICFTLLDDKPHLFGQQRLWGSVGWGITSLSSGFLIDTMSGGQVMKDYSILFYMMLGILACDIVAGCMIKNVQFSRPASMMSQVGRLFRSGRNNIFFVWCILVGILTSMIWNFLFWHLEELSEAAGAAACDDSAIANMKTLQGLVSAVQTFGGEIPCLFLSGWLLKRIGHAHAMSLVLGAFGVRFLCYSLLVNPWWVLPVEMLQGVTFGIFFTTMGSYASVMAPPHAQATLQGLAGAIFEGVGVSAGGAISGYTMEHLGGPLAFRCFCYVSFALCAGHIFLQFMMDRWCPVQSRMRPEDRNTDVVANILDSSRSDGGTASMNPRIVKVR